MKIMKYMIQVLLVGGLLTSCIEDADVTAYLTEDQLGNVAQEDPDKAFSAAVAGMYTDMQQYVDVDMQHNYFGQKSFDYLSSLMGNDMIMTGRFGMSLYHYLLDYWQQNYNPTNNRWKEYYRAIANANSILKLIDPNSEDPANLKYRAIALGFRGYAYLQLTYLYQYSYYTGADGTKWGHGEKYDFSQAPCVPLITEHTEGDQPRATVAQIYEQELCLRQGGAGQQESDFALSDYRAVAELLSVGSRPENRTSSPDTLSVGKDGLSYQGRLEVWFAPLQSRRKHLSACAVYPFCASGVQRTDRSGGACSSRKFMEWF